MVNAFLLLLIFLKNYSSIVLNRLDPDQAGHFVESNLGPNCLQRLSAGDTGRQSELFEYLE